MGFLCSLYPRKSNRPENPEWHIDTVEIKTGSSEFSEFFKNVTSSDIRRGEQQIKIVFTNN
jgi:hypothetical protein